MAVFGASFVRAQPDRATALRETSRLIRESVESWLAASPTNLAVDNTLRATEGSEWISIENGAPDQALATISRLLQTVAITLHASDEIMLRFSYKRFDGGRVVRALEYDDDGARGRWTQVDGEPETWEALLFATELLELYRKHAADDVHEVCAENAIKLGFSIPWACDAGTVAQIARALELPWVPGSFPPAAEIDIVRGSPERLEAFRRQHRRPWWRFGR
jgi:hypothetical protein